MTRTAKSTRNNFGTFEDITPVSFEKSNELRLIYMDGEHYPEHKDYAPSSEKPVEAVPDITPIEQSGAEVTPTVDTSASKFARDNNF